jgi:hypothetical protein
MNESGSISLEANILLALLIDATTYDRVCVNYVVTGR